MHSFLTAKFYRMTLKFDIEKVVKVMLGKILRFAILLILYIDSKLLYNFLVKIDTTNKKRLMVDMMILCQLYK